MRRLYVLRGVVFALSCVALSSVALAQDDVDGVPSGQLGPAPFVTDPRVLAPTHGVPVRAALGGVDSTNRQAVVDFHNAVYVPALAVANGWTGNTAGCVAGTTSPAYANATLDMVNYFRAMTGLPAVVTHEAIKDGKAQKAALLMSANNRLSHTLEGFTACMDAPGVNPDAREAAGKSNLALGLAGPNAITVYISDYGTNNSPLGHRRWILYPPQVEMGTGSTRNANDLWVIGAFGTRPSSPEFVAWPPAGYVPFRVAYPRWSFSVNRTGGADFANATVSMTRSGTPVAVVVISRTNNGYGDNTIAWEPAGLNFTTGMADQPITVNVQNVRVAGVARSYTYTVTVFDPAVADETDADEDGLPDSWEISYGLDPSSASGGDGASADPDLDGLTNAQERAAGTHPRGFFTRYLAEGAVSALFETRLALANPGATAALVNVRYLVADGAPRNVSRAVPSMSRRTVFPLDTLGAGTVAFSTVVESDQPVVVDRTMSWNSTSRYGAHAETSIAGPATTWYLAEGSTNGFSLFYLLQNPNDVAASVRVRYLLGSGAPLEKTYALEPSSRTNIWVNEEEFPGLGKALARADVSAVFESLDGRPIIVERAMYLDAFGQQFGAGHGSAAVTAPATEWFLAEGATGPFFDLFVLMANPGPADAQVDATYLLPDGSTLTVPHTVAANTRSNIWVDIEDERLANTAVSTTIRSTNGQPIIVERAMWWPDGHWYGAHNSAGATVTGTKWALAEGEVGGVPDRDTYLLVANTSAWAATVAVKVLCEDGTVLQQTFPVGARSRFNVDVRHDFPEAVGKRFASIVESLGATPAQVVVEQAMYWDALGQAWAAGTNTLATRLR